MSQSEEARQPDTRNVYQRKLAVMAKCGSVGRDGNHDHYGFRYVTVQNLSNHLRKALVEEGLDVEFDFSGEDGLLKVVLINVDKPTDPNERIVSSWPIVQDDKGYAYTTKFPLIRMFQIGDDTEGDEADLAKKSGEAVNRLKKSPNSLSARGQGPDRPVPSPVALRRATALPPTKDTLMDEARKVVAEKFGTNDSERVEVYLERLAEAKYETPLGNLTESDVQGLIESLRTQYA